MSSSFSKEGWSNRTSFPGYPIPISSRMVMNFATSYQFSDTWCVMNNGNPSGRNVRRGGLILHGNGRNRSRGYDRTRGRAIPRAVLTTRCRGNISKYGVASGYTGYRCLSGTQWKYGKSRKSRHRITNTTNWMTTGSLCWVCSIISISTT